MKVKNIFYSKKHYNQRIVQTWKRMNSECLNLILLIFVCKNTYLLCESVSLQTPL